MSPTLSLSFLSFVSFLSFLAVPAFAQPCPPLEIRNPAGNYIIPGSKGDIPYADGLALDAYVQRGGSARPSVVVIHGGRWSSGSRVAHVGQLLELLTYAGYHWFSVDYRARGLSGYEDSLADLRAALAFIRCRASAFGIDGSRLVLLGEDSGAHLAALLAAERPAGVIGTVLLGGIYEPGAIPSLARDERAEILARASLMRHLTGLPPLLVVHGGADTESPIEHARRYCEAVSRSAAGCRFIEVAGASHRSENWWPNQWGYKREVVAWLASLSPGRTLTYQPLTGGVTKDIVFSHSPALTLDAFVPESSRPVPAVIVVHGGGWEAGDKVTYVTPLFEPLARAGLAWFSIDYRLTPEVEHADQIEDVRRAIRFVRAEHARFNVDPTQIFLLGESASAQIVTLLAAEDRSLAGIISFYGVYDLPAMVTDVSPRSLLVRLFRRTTLDDSSRAVLQKYSPVFRAHKDMPPVLLINGTGERLWEQAQHYARRLAELGVPHETIALADAPHGLENWEGREDWMVYKRRLVEWISRVR